VIIFTKRNILATENTENTENTEDTENTENTESLFYKEEKRKKIGLNKEKKRKRGFWSYKLSQ